MVRRTRRLKLLKKPLLPLLLPITTKGKVTCGKYKILHSSTIILRGISSLLPNIKPWGTLPRARTVTCQSCHILSSNNTSSLQEQLEW